MTESLLAALMTVVQPYNIAVMFFGTLIGILVGAMPGLSSVMGLSIMMPLTLSMEGNSGVLMLLGIFCGAIYGGSITAILIKTPGTANSAATCLDGYPMATKLGQPGRALSISTMASTFGGLFSAVMLLWTAPMLSKIALKFGAAEYFALAVFGLSMHLRQERGQGPHRRGFGIDHGHHRHELPDRNAPLHLRFRLSDGRHRHDPHPDRPVRILPGTQQH